MGLRIGDGKEPTSGLPTNENRTACNISSRLQRLYRCFDVLKCAVNARKRKGRIAGVALRPIRAKPSA
jgi:hypothetical protein